MVTEGTQGLLLHAVATLLVPSHVGTYFFQAFAEVLNYSLWAFMRPYLELFRIYFLFM